MKIKPLAPIVEIRRSCITGKVVWVYRGRTKAAAHVAYWRACKAEIERVKQWPEIMARRRAWILKILNDAMANLPIDAELTPEQKQAAKELQAMAKKEPPCDREFYNHIMEERRRRKEDKEIRRKMREREEKERQERENKTKKI